MMVGIRFGDEGSMSDLFIQSASSKFRYIVSPPGCCYQLKKLDASSKQSYSQKMLKPSAEYNRRAAIIEGLRTERSATEIIRFFGYQRSTIYDVVTKYTVLE